MSELGEQLKKTRLEKGMSLEEVQAVTKIQKRYLEAIENGEFEKLPGSFYTKAFVKNYAEMLNLNYDSLIAHYGHELPQSPQPSESLPPRKTKSPVFSQSHNRLMAILPGVLIFLIIVGILAVVWLLKIKNSDDLTLQDNRAEQNVEIEQNEDAITDEENKVEPMSEEDAEQQEDIKRDGEVDETQRNDDMKESGTLEQTKVQGDTTEYILAGTHQFHVAFTFSGNSWLKIQGESGKMHVNEGFSENDEVTFDFSDEKSVRIRIGSAPHIAMTVNQVDVQIEPQPVAQTVKIAFDKLESATR